MFARVVLGVILQLLAVLLFLCSIPLPASTLAWTPNASTTNPATNTTGYNLHYGPATGIYTTTIDEGKATIAPVPALTPGTYYFAVTAYNAAHSNGLYSNEVSLIVATPTPIASATPSSSPTPTPVTPTPTATTKPTPTPSSKFVISNQVRAVATLNVRATPAGTLLGTQPVNAVGTITGGPQWATFNGVQVNWWMIQFFSGVSGWVGEDNLSLIPTTPAPTPIIAPAPTPTPATPTPTPTPASTFNTWNTALATEENTSPTQAQLAAWVLANPPTAD